MRRCTAPLLTLLAIAIAFGAQAQQETCPNGDAFVAAIFSDAVVRPQPAPEIQWQRLDNPNATSSKLTLTWSPAKQKNVFRAAADRFWNHAPAPLPAPAPAPMPTVASSASVFSIDPNHATLSHSAFARGFALASISTPNNLSLNYVDPGLLSSLNATWQTPWWGLIVSGAFAATGQKDLRIGKPFAAGSKRLILFAECSNCTNRTVSIISTDVASDASYAPSMPRFFLIAARVDF